MLNWLAACHPITIKSATYLSIHDTFTDTFELGMFKSGGGSGLTRHSGAMLPEL